MIETNIPNLSVEEIMQKIKREVEKRKSTSIQDTSTYEGISNYKVSNNKLDVVSKRNIPFVVKDVYEYSDFTKYHDVEFITNLYRGVLKREPDIAGLHHYLHLLRSGERTKSQIISSLRYSAEGKSKSVKVLGSKKRYLANAVTRVPFLGKVLQWSMVLFTLLKMVKRINEYEAHTNQRFSEIKEDIVSLQNAINDKTDIENINHIQDNISTLSAFVNAKGNKNEVEQELSKKTNKEEIKDIKEEIKSINRELEAKVHENTLIEAQKGIDLKLEKKVNINELPVLDIPASLEIEAMDFLADAISKFPHPIDRFKDFNKDELYYSLFESTFYNHSVVLEKQKIYLEYIPNINSAEYMHLDIGCGRGEFLTLLKRNDYYAKGIDINSLEVKTLTKQNFDVDHSDMIDFLETTDNHFSSISAFQVIEHIDYDVLKKFVELAYTKIVKDGVIILETINPHNKVAFNSFYMDETHKRPLPPEMVAFILQYAGFKNIKFRYSSPMPKEYRSKDSYYNYINYHDYAVIGYKI